ncbi:MAG: uroporphyrinogen decarboxylase family protein [Oscillospiraceae bacterium]
MIHRTGDPEWVPLSWNYSVGRFATPSAVMERPKDHTDGVDWYGCHWHFDEATFGYVQDPAYPLPVDDITQWRDQVQFPDYDAIDWEACAAEDEKNYDRENKLVKFILESGPFERLHSLVGFEEALVSMYTEPEAFQELIEAITDSKIDLIHRIAQYYHPDGLCVFDDLGSASGPLMSLEMYREFIKPSHKRIVDAIRSHGIIAFQHSCGKMQDFLDDFVEIGIQVVNPLQPVNDWEMVAEKYRDKLSFEVSLSTASSMVDADEKTIREDVRRAIDTFGPHKNFMLFPTVTEPWKMDIVRDEMQRYGFTYYKQ